MGSDSPEPVESAAVPAEADGAQGINEQEQSALMDLVSSYKDAQASNLSSLMVDKSVTISTPEISYVSEDDLKNRVPDELIEVKLDFSEGLQGGHSFLLPVESATSIAGTVVGQDDVELNDMALGALTEALSTITGVALTTIGDKIGATIMPVTGESSKIQTANLQVPPGGAVMASYSIDIEGVGPQQVYETFDMTVVKGITVKIVAPTVAPQAAAAPAGGMAQPSMAQAASQTASNPNQFTAGMPGLGDNQADMSMGMQFGGPNVQPVQFPNLGPSAGSQDSGNISLLMDVYMEMSVELGRTKKPIREILGMGEGTIIELDKLAGEPVDILVNHKLIATGEVVVIDENFGVRVTEIVSPSERMKEIT